MQKTSIDINLWRSPCVDSVSAEPDGDIASVSKRLLILRPVLDTVGCLIIRMSIRSLMGIGHADLHWIYGFYMLIM
jgi:hypothetical protein